MTNLTFAELTALIAVNGLTVNDRYYITDKNWTIIAITTNSYRIVVPIVTEVTKAELDALVAANGLNEGLQYKVTDKDWLLIATGNNSLSAVNGVITIINGDVLPDYVDSDIIRVDTGIITTDINSDTGLPLHITKPIHYFPAYMIIHVIVKTAGVMTDLFGSWFTSPKTSFSQGTKSVIYPFSTDHVDTLQDNDSLEITGNGGGNTVRFVIEYRKSIL